MRQRIATCLLALLGLCGLTGCEDLSARQRQMLVDGEQAYQQHQYRAAIEGLTRFVNEVPDRPETNRALYVRALARLRAGRRLDARSDLQRCADSSTDPDLRWRAYTVLGTIDIEDQQWGNAARFYAAAADIAPKQSPTDTILFRLGTCYERTGRWRDARVPFSRIVTDFPNSPVFSAAQRRLRLNAEYFAIQCGAFATRTNADNLAADLKRKALNAYVYVEPRDNGQTHIVLVGRYARYDEASNALAAVRQQVSQAIMWP